MSNCNQFNGLKDRLEKKELDYVNLCNELCLEALIKVFRMWAKAFPKRDLICIHGMGIYSWDSDGLDLIALLAHYRQRRCGWRPVYDRILKPLLDYNELWGDIGAGVHACPPDIKYNPITKTIEYNNIIEYVK